MVQPNTRTLLWSIDRLQLDKICSSIVEKKSQRATDLQLNQQKQIAIVY